jgi:hypothetical protein
MDPFQGELEVHRIYQEARIHRNSYFEKLAILDGGTVALIVTAVLGPLHGAIKHKYLLGVGLSSLVIAMLTLYWRNFLAAEFEFHAATNTTMRDPRHTGGATTKVWKKIQNTESAGLMLSAAGIVLLLIEVWLILI